MRLITILIFFSLCSCEAPRPHPKVILPAFYAWKTAFKSDLWTQQTLQKWNTNRIYIKYADIDFKAGKGAFPVSTTKLDFEDFDQKIAIIPVFFVINRVFSHTNELESAALATRMMDYIKAQTPSHLSVPEIQIDCDWNASTKEAYFLFLKQLKNEIEKIETTPKPIISATIRLHQVKYQAKTGIPPVNRGLLMLYNFEAPNLPKVKNSIIDSKIAKEYLSNLKAFYPLPLDAALPIFGWGLHFRNEVFQGFLHDFNTTNAADYRFLTRLEKNIFRVNTDTSAFATYFRRGDWIRTESADFEELTRVWESAKPIISNDTCQLIFFDLNEKNLNKFRYEDLSKLFKNTD
jgi:hypothetical protein